MQFVLLGFVVGIFAIGVPGPVSVSLVHVATTQGRRSGARAAIGVASGDLILAAVAMAIITAGRILPDVAFTLLQVVSAMLLLVVGGFMTLRPATVRERAAGVTQPFRTFLAVTALLPTALGTWLAMLAAMPFAGDRQSLAAFAAGVVCLSVVWHLLLGLGAGSIGDRLTPAVMSVATRLGGLSMIVLGFIAAVSRLA